MNTADLLRMRLRAQLIEGSSARTPHDVVSHLLALQAQDYAGAVWALGLRLPGSTLGDIERAIAQGTILRTWPMRGTLHFVTAEDVHWMLPLLTPRIIARSAKRHAELGLDEATIHKARELFSAALIGGRRLTRPEAMAMLDAAGIDSSGQRGYLILWRLAQEGLLVVGPMEGRQQTFRLLAEWVPADKSSLPPDAPREEALAMLARRYVTSHGPATVGDLARWADIPKREAAAALAAVADELESTEHDGERHWFAPQVAAADVAARLTTGDAATGARQRGASQSVHLLPGFDEYMLGYVGRGHQLGEHLEKYGARVGSNGMLAATVVIDGAVVGVWKRALKPGSVSVAVTEFRKLSTAERSAIRGRQLEFARFLGRELVARDEVDG